MKKIISYILNACMLLCIFSFTQMEAAWNLPAVPISSTNSNSPEIGIDSHGNAVAIWQGSNGSNSIIMGATLPTGGGWTTPVNISVAGQDATVPQVAVDSHGNAVAVWVRSDGTNTIIQGAVLPFGASSWTPTSDLSLPGADAFVPQVALDPHGNAVAVWQRINILGRNVTQGATLAFGELFWTPTSDLSAAPEDTYVPQLGVDQNGNAVAVWSNVTYQTIQAATLPFGSALWSPFTTISGTQAGTPEVAVNAAGYAIAVWARDNSGLFEIESATLPFGGSWSSPLSVSSGALNFEPIVAIDHAGNATALWSNSTGSDIFAQAATLAFGATSWSSTTTLTNTGEQAFDVRVAVDQAGNAIAIWDNTVGTDTLIQSATLPFGGSWSSVTTLSSVGEIADFPQIAVDHTGLAVANWTNETQTKIFAASWFPAPAVTSVSPHQGSTAGGNMVVIHGVNFVNVSGIAFGTNTVSDFTVISPTVIHATAPAGAAGTVNVTVTTASGTSSTTPNDQYTYRIHR